MTRTRFGVICSTNGSALRGALAILNDCNIHPEPYIISDRKCGIVDWANSSGIKSEIIPWISKAEFSIAAEREFAKGEIDNVLLFYTRLIGSPLIDTARVSNIHPSLLPSYPGLFGLRDAINGGALLLGASLHMVDQGVDTGKLMAQALRTGLSDLNRETAEKVSYLQKIWLCLIWLCSLSDKVSNVPYLSPISQSVQLSTMSFLDDRVLEKFQEFEASHFGPDLRS